MPDGTEMPTIAFALDGCEVAAKASEPICGRGQAAPAPVRLTVKPVVDEVF